ncbi:MAG: LPS assembly lipoprotein LptE [Gammaproteobacteria bacterium]
MTVTARALFLLLPLLLTACGYSLRGGANLDDRFSALQVNVLQPNSELGRQLQNSLQAAGLEFELVTTLAAAEDTLLLMVADEQSVRRPVSINPRARAAQYEIRLAVDFILMDGETTVIPRETLTVERSYLEDIENIAGSREEMEIVTSEMRRDLVNLLIRRLEATEIAS